MSTKLNLSEIYLELIQYQQTPDEHKLCISMGRELRKLRLEMGYSIRQMATELNLEKEVILAVESGSGNPATGRKLLGIVKWLQLHPSKWTKNNSTDISNVVSNLFGTCNKH